MAIRSRGDERHVEVCVSFPVLQFVCHCSEGKSLDALSGGIASGTVCEGAWNLWNFGDPAAIGLLFSFDPEDHLIHCIAYALLERRHDDLPLGDRALQ